MRRLLSVAAILPLALSAVAAEPSPDLDALLSRIEAKAQTVKTMESRLRLVRRQGLLDDEQVRYGKFSYEAAAGAVPTRFRVDFDGVVVNGTKEDADIRYAFDGFWLLEANTKTRTATRRELRAADDPKDALAKGGGVLPLPLPFDKAALLARFEARLGQPGPTADKREAVRLLLTPKPGVKTDVDRMELAFEKDSLLPIAAQSWKGEDTTEVFLSKPAFNPALPADCFGTKLPEGKDWQTQEVPLK